MNSRIVNKAIGASIKPVLRQHGFQASTARTFWRHGTEKIDVLCFQSFNSYLAGSVGCTTYSFAVRLGSYLTYLPPLARRPKRRGGSLAPQEYQCQFRGTLANPLAQPEMVERASKIRDVWYIDPEGHYVPCVIETLKQLILDTGLKWFMRFDNPTEVLRILREEQEDLNDGTWGFGGIGSPIRFLFTGYAACRLRLPEVALPALRAALDSGVFKSTESEIVERMATCG